jgi:hypothetical protein
MFVAVLAAVVGVSIVVAAGPLASRFGGDRTSSVRAGAPGVRAPGLLATTPPGWGSVAVVCNLTHREAIDPIVNPGSPRSAHEHDFFGNLHVDERSDGAGLRRTEGACEHASDRSAYWVPTVRRDGIPVDPDHAVVYYRTAPWVDDVAEPPVGLQLIGGGVPGAFAWSCGAGPLLQQAPTRCDGAAALRLHIAFPDCWDGRPAWTFEPPTAVIAPDGAPCPDDHPVRLPMIELVVHTGLTGELGAVTVSSEPEMRPHADLIAAWPSGGLPTLLADCLAAHDDCTAGS